MILIGTLMTFLGFLLAVLSLGMAAGVGARMIVALIGLAVSLVGIIGVLNRGFMKNAIWRR